MQDTHLLSTSVMQCAKCKQAKPIADFKTKSTNAQAQAWGYKRAIEIVSKNCKACRKPRKKVRDMTLKEIQNKIASGDIFSHAIGELAKQQRIAKGKRGITEGLVKRWKNKRAKDWANLFTSSDKEYERVRAYTYKKDLDPELHAFYTAYLAQIKQARNHFSLQCKLGTLSPKRGLTWWQYISHPSRDRLINQWESIPFALRQHMNKPQLIGEN